MSKHESHRVEHTEKAQETEDPSTTGRAQKWQS